jgi:hypothetical protein
MDFITINPLTVRVLILLLVEYYRTTCSATWCHKLKLFLLVLYYNLFTVVLSVEVKQICNVDSCIFQRFITVINVVAAALQRIRVH